ncbi:MAG: hypothetical protein IJ195_00070 [Lachnospiraceae bacterium]|nr:hypothetical protein [Lachnospiraceae bacterium]
MKKAKWIPEVIFCAASVLVCLYTCDVPGYRLLHSGVIGIVFLGFGIWKYSGQELKLIIFDLLKEIGTSLIVAIFCMYFSEINSGENFIVKCAYLLVHYLILWLYLCVENKLKRKKKGGINK